MSWLRSGTSGFTSLVLAALSGCGSGAPPKATGPLDASGDARRSEASTTDARGQADARDAGSDANRDARSDTSAPSDSGADALTDSPIGSESGPSDAVADHGTATRPPYDWVGVIGTGQSLSVGHASVAISTTQPYQNRKLADLGHYPRYPIVPDAGAWSAIPLTEPVRAGNLWNGEDAGFDGGPGYSDGEYPMNFTGGETPHSGMANTLSLLWQTRGGADSYVTAHSVVGWGGHPLVSIDKEGVGGVVGRAYPASLNEAKIFARLAAAADKSFGYGGVVLTHGEADANNPAYGAGLYQFWQDYNADLKSITGQSSDVVLFASQQSTEGWGNYDNSAVQLWEAADAHLGQIVCTGPKYEYGYVGDHLHMPAPGYERLGQKYAEVFDLVVNQKVAWRPLEPLTIARSETTITLAMHVPNPPLNWDETLAPPHQLDFTEWKDGRGFEALDAQRHRLTITNVAISGSSIVLSLASIPDAGAITVAYAITQDGNGDGGGGNEGGLVQGLRGQLRDSDPFVGADEETVMTTVTAGSPNVTSSAGFVRRAERDVVVASGFESATIVNTVTSNNALVLSSPWTGASGQVPVTFHHDHHNYLVHFAMTVP